MSEMGMRVPLVVNYPAGGVSSQVLDDPIDFSDMLPTLAELGGAELPKGVTIDGQSFAGRLTGRKDYKPREWAYVSYYGKSRGTATHFARDTRYKLYEGNYLYDFHKDPAHAKPIDPASADPGARTARKKLSAVLEQMKAQFAKGDKYTGVATKLLDTKPGLSATQPKKPKNKGGKKGGKNKPKK